jgi:hypothetical protein
VAKWWRAGLEDGLEPVEAEPTDDPRYIILALGDKRTSVKHDTVSYHPTWKEAYAWRKRRLEQDRDWAIKELADHAKLIDPTQ